MGNPRGVRRDFQALEKRRLAAVKLFGEEFNNSEISRRLKVCNQTVSRWRKQYAAGGKSALYKAGRAGRKPLLSAADQQRLVELLQQGPERLGFETPLWTCWRVAHLIEKEFGISYHSGHVWKLLRALNWSVQRPVGRALERDEDAIREWKSKRWPALKKSLSGRAHHRLHRRKRIDPTAASLPYLGSARGNPGPPISFQLEDDFGGRGHDAVEFLFPNLRKGDRTHCSMC
jgi:transposase